VAVSRRGLENDRRARRGTIVFVGRARAFSGTLDLSRGAHFNNAVLAFSRASSEPNRDHPRWNRWRIATSCWNMLAFI
jgi:hypothetical protein